MNFNFYLWLQIVANLSQAIAVSQGRDSRALGYFQFVSNASTMAALTDADLTELNERYLREAASGVEPTPEELEALAQRLLERSAEIQSA